MSQMKEIAMSAEETLEQIQTFIKHGRACLDALEKICRTVREDFLSQAAETPAAAPGTEPEAAPKRTAALEEVRKLLAEKARAGYRAEVKALLSRHGANQLSDIADPVKLGEMLTEAEKIGAADA